MQENLIFIHGIYAIKKRNAKCKMQINVEKSSQKLSAASEKSGTVSPHLNDGLYALLGIYPFFHAVR